MKNLTYLVLVGMTLFFVQACQDKHGKNYNISTKLNQDGIVFIKSGIEGGLTEIKASGIVITNSNNHRVIAFAKMMIDDHTKAGDELKKIETDKEVAETDTIGAGHMKTINDLSKKSGASFDKAYMQMMVADHNDAIKLFTTAAQNPDTTVSKFANSTLPTLKMHLDSANAILTSLSKR